MAAARPRGPADDASEVVPTHDGAYSPTVVV
jgi:hypothetical protein